MAQEYAAQALFGASDINGIMPVTATDFAHFGHGFRKDYPQKRLGYDLPEAVGMSSDTLITLDSLAAQLISSGAAPGCQILVAKDNKIVWNKAYGHYTYDKKTPVTTSTIFDLASVTKVAATTVSVMKLAEEGRLSVDNPISDYVQELKQTNKSSLTFRKVMAHHAGLKAWIPFYKQTVTGSQSPASELYTPAEEKQFHIPVARDLYLRDDWRDTVWQQIFDSQMLPEEKYVYSDLGLYLCARAVNRVSNIPLDQYAFNTYYRPLGMSTTCFNPWERGWTDRCAPTEVDTYFRDQEIQGYVHDMGAAMLGGVSGHAGLFSSANDLAKLFQMLLNGGVYGQKRYLKPETVQQFTTRYEKSTRRGIGFDMKEQSPDKELNMGAMAGPDTFGHLGFTGTCVWADPDKNLVYIFLSNRTYPSMDNGKLGAGNFRPRIQNVIYRAVSQGQ